MFTAILNDVLSFLRFVTDTQTRDTLASILHVVAKNQKDWKKDIKSVKAEFNGGETHTLAVFINNLLDDFLVIGLSKAKIADFKIVFSELINNAFEHGCRHSEKCTISVQCVYSKWFVHLQVSDSGKGFDLDKTLESLQEQRELDPKKLKHGLQVVKNIAFRLYTNKKGNSIAAVLMGQDNISVIPSTTNYRGQEILVLTIDSDRAWYHLTADWTPLIRTIENQHHKKLVLIDATVMDWSTKESSNAKIVVQKFSGTTDRFYAFVVSDLVEDEFELSNLDTENIKVFRHSEITQAKTWLIEKTR